MVIANEISKESATNTDVAPFENPENLVPGKFNSQTAEQVNDYLSSLINTMVINFNASANKKKIISISTSTGILMHITCSETTITMKEFQILFEKYMRKNKILEYDHQLVQHYDPIYQDPYVGESLTLRTHFYSPVKPFLGKTFDTYLV